MFDQAIVVEEYDRDGALAAPLARLRAAHPISRIVALAERDMVRAARMRAALGIAGQAVDSALHFTDKWVMKQRLRARGVTVAAGRPVETADEVTAFAAIHGWPVVLKPLSGTGSFGVVLVSDPVAAARYLAEAKDLGARRALAEALVQGRQYHVDGLVVEGRPVLTWPSAYLNSPLAHRQGLPVGGVLLAPGAPFVPRLTAMVADVLRALPTPSTFAFHAEIFRTPADELVLGEIASRPGGLQISDMLSWAFGIDYRATVFRALSVDALQAPPAGPARLAGWLALPTCAGRVLAVASHCDLPFVVHYALAIAPGHVMSPPRHANDFAAGFVVTGGDEDAVEKNLRRAAAWFSENCRLEDA